MKKILILIALATIFGSLTFIFAQTKDNGNADGKRPPRGEGFRPPPHKGHGGIPPFVMEKLNLTDAQKEQIEAFELTARESSKEYFERMKNSDEQLRAIVESGNFDEAKARQILNEKANIMTELELIRLRKDAAVLKVLTAEQKTQLEALKNQRPPRGEGFMPPPPPDFE